MSRQDSRSDDPEFLEEKCPLTCLNRLAPTCVIHRPQKLKNGALTPHVRNGG